MLFAKFFILSGCAWAAETIVTQDTLSLTVGEYSSILFRVSGGKKSQIPAQYSFANSGAAPLGMIFESYPCNKPGEKHCVMLASSDGIFLDGVPRKAGRYKITISAKASDGAGIQRGFTIMVKDKRGS